MTVKALTTPGKGFFRVLVAEFSDLARGSSAIAIVVVVLCMFRLYQAIARTFFNVLGVRISGIGSKPQAYTTKR